LDDRGAVKEAAQGLHWQTPVESMVTGLVLVAAVILDATAPKRRAAR
jgi:ABC-type xylose transport system permease subunit